ncbi:MAG: hypothetical protein MUC43_07275 [Pirellula sp.]|nr:hypothetical protein [Pirellula sp.]
MMFDMVVVGQQRTNLPSRSPEGSKGVAATDDRATQRWIPIDRRKLGELGRLGELLQNPKSALESSSSTQQSEFNTDSSPRSLPLDLSKVDLRDLEERLAGLTPEQRERLKKLANQLSKNDAAKELSSAYKNLPQGLVDQVRESPSLREFAKEVLEEGQGEEQPKDSDSLLLDDSNNQPWIKFDPANSSLKANAKNQTQDANSDIAESNSGSEGHSRKEGDTLSIPKPSDAPERGVGLNRYNDAGSTRSREGESNSENRERQLQNGNRRSSEFGGNASRASNDNSNRSRPSQQNAGQQNARQQSAGQKNAGQQTNRVANSGNQKPETAFEALKRRVGELGLGQTFEKLAKEAVGIEKSREGNVNDKPATEKSAADSNLGTALGTRDSRRDAAATKRPAEFPRRDSAKPSESSSDSQGRGAADRQTLAQNQSAPVRPSAPKSESVSQPASSQSSETNNPLSSWRTPTWNDLPSFSYWYLVGAILIILILGSLVLINRSPEIAKRVAQRRQEAEQRARLLDMEIANREQVVLAFDTFVSKQLRSFEDWWTSQRVVKYVSDQKLGYSSQLLAAEKVYKNARYSPPDQKLSEQELATVRDAIRQCAKSKETE